MKQTRRDFIKTSAVAGATVGVAGLYASDTSQSERKITMPTQRSKALIALFGLKYPIFEAPHGFTTSPELAIAVSNAGAMGALASLGAISALRASGAKLGIQVTSAESARVAVDLGADYLVCQGTEAGGHVQATRGLYEALPIG